MAWPTPDIELLATVQASGPTITATFTPPAAGQLLIAFYHSGTGAEATPAGWTEVFRIAAHNAPGYARISDGTESSVAVTHGEGFRQTTLHVFTVRAAPTLLGFANRIDGPAVITTTPGLGTHPLDDAASVGIVDTRIDFVIGNTAPGGAPNAINPEPIVISGTGGQAFQRSTGIWATPLGATAPGSTIPGATYDEVVHAATILLRLGRGGWRINRIGFG